MKIADGYSELDRDNVTGNGWGAGLFSLDSDLSFDNIIVSNNKLTGDRGAGAGLGLQNSRATVTNSSFKGNIGVVGGGLNARNVSNGGPRSLCVFR